MRAECCLSCATSIGTKLAYIRSTSASDGSWPFADSQGVALRQARVVGPVRGGEGEENDELKLTTKEMIHREIYENFCLFTHPSYSVYH